VQTAVVISALSQGWYVSVADDTGVQAAFGAGLHSAYTTLDSIRAVKQSGRFTGIDSDPTITLNGYSGGALAASWASELHSSYAPELKIAGAALGGLSPNITALLGTLAFPFPFDQFCG
jgi:Secretory lipase